MSVCMCACKCQKLTLVFKEARKHLRYVKHCNGQAPRMQGSQLTQSGKYDIGQNFGRSRRLESSANENPNTARNDRSLTVPQAGGKR